jgi:hypothetical protein
MQMFRQSSSINQAHGFSEGKYKNIPLVGEEVTIQGQTPGLFRVTLVDEG